MKVLDAPEEHPPTARGHMQPRTMGDPCPVCGGTEYYCTHMVDLVLSNENNNFDAVIRAVSELYNTWYKLSPMSPRRAEAIQNLLDAWDRWLG